MKSSFFVHRNLVKNTVGNNIFCGFIEHLGRAVYSGIFEPGHPMADEDGFRQDVIALLRELNMPMTRYPGGNFVSSFDWKDSIGPVENRPVRFDYNWFARETNKFGLHEFVKWCKQVDTEPIYSVNLGTATPKDAMQCVEYCNGPTGSYWSDLRCHNGSEKPFGIRYWCLGNEMDGPWQVGQKSGAEYGRIAREASKMMKMVDPNIKTILCGSSNQYMPTYASFDLDALDEAYDYIDFLSLHCYYGNAARNWPAFWASAERMDCQIEDMIACCDAIKAKHKSHKKMMLSFDEWNVWYRDHSKRPEQGTPFSETPCILEEKYDMADVLTDGGLLMSLMDHADRVGIACIAQSVNVIAPIMTRPNGGCWKQTIFYPFAYMSKYGRGEVLRQKTVGPVYEAHGMQVPYLRSIVIHHPETKELVIFAINRSMDESLELNAEFGGFKLDDVLEAIEIHNDNLDAINTEETEAVHPEKISAEKIQLAADGLVVSLKPASWNMLRIRYAD